MNTLSFDFGAIPAQTADVRRVPVRSHLRRVRGDAESAPYVKGSETSQAAAEALPKQLLTDQNARVLFMLRKHGPLTDEQIGGLLAGEMMVSSARRARIRLRDSGQVRQCENKRVASSGVMVFVWEAVG